VILLKGNVHRHGGWVIFLNHRIAVLRDEPVIAREFGPLGPYPKLRCKRFGRWLVETGLE
jgi:hypothetical protein